MLCYTCMYDSDEGWCGLGNELEGGACSGYIKGDKPIPVIDDLPPSIRRLMATGKGEVPGIQFPVRAELELLTGTIPSPVYAAEYTFALLEGEVGYQILIENVDGMYSLGWGPCGLSIYTDYARAGVVGLVLTIRHLHRFPLYEQVDMGSYIWWLDPNVPAWSVELFLHGLVAVRRMHAVFRDRGYFYTRYYQLTPNLYYPYQHDPIDWKKVPNKDVVLPPLPTGRKGDYHLDGRTVHYWYHRGVFDYLIAKYMCGTKDFPTKGRAHAEEYIRQWEVILHEYSMRLI